MGIHDRDYERSYDTGSGWRDGPGYGGAPRWTANGALLAVIGAVYLGQLVIPGLTEALCLPADWFRRPWLGYSLGTHALLHSTENFGHLLFNCLAIFFFGRAVESRLGGREYLAFFFAAAAFAGAAWCLFEALGAGFVPRGPVLLGASGAISAIVVLFALWYPHVQVLLMGVLPVPAWLMAVLFVAQDVAGAIDRSGNVAYTAHLGGALFGYLYYRSGWRLAGFLPSGFGRDGASFFPRPGVLRRRPNLRVHREDDGDNPSDPDDDRVDEVLRKIQAQGQASLTKEERRVLEQASQRYKRRRS